MLLHFLVFLLQSVEQCEILLENQHAHECPRAHLQEQTERGSDRKGKTLFRDTNGGHRVPLMMCLDACTQAVSQCSQHGLRRHGRKGCWDRMG